MSTFWKVRKQFSSADDSTQLTWPADVELRFKLRPADFYGVVQQDTTRTTMHGTTQFRVDGRTGKYAVDGTGTLPPLTISASFQEGSLQILGDTATLRARATDAQHCDRLINWVIISLSELLSVRIGIFSEVTEIEGTVSGQRIAALYPGGTYSIVLANVVDPEDRADYVTKAFEGLHMDNPSYWRLVTSARYFHHALRLVAPSEINFIPYAASAEVLLNLAKCLEILFASTSRDEIREKLIAFSYSPEQIESQLISILRVRSEIDVAHPTSASATPSDVATLRRFVDRSIRNTGALLRRVADRARDSEITLDAVDHSPSDKRAKLARQLEEYLRFAELDPSYPTPRIISSS